MKMTQYTLGTLPYIYNALEPFISAQTVELHYDKHHRAYVNNLNTLLDEKGWAVGDLESIIIQTHKNADHINIFNNAGQVWNHDFYWQSIAPNGGGMPSISFQSQIDKDFGSFANFRSEFIKTGVSQFGSGWVWLVWSKKLQRLLIVKSPNAESPMLNNQKALCVCDVWEHSYYLDYQNKRFEYLEKFIDNLVSWVFVESNFHKAIK